MSGAEAIAVLGVISSIIAIVDGIKEVCDAAADAEGLPKAFREVASRLPIVRNILDSAKQYINKGDIDEKSCKAVKHVVDTCEKKAKKLDELFRKAIPADGASRAEQYFSAFVIVGKKSQVEVLMKRMLEDVQLLANHRAMKTVTEAQAITGLSPVLYSSIPTQGSKEDECLTALFLTDPRDDREKLVQRKGSRVDGTCEWIKTNAFYNSWLRSHSQLLWLSGSPGKGKTMISIFLAEELEQTARFSQNTLFLQYFCDNKDDKRNTAVTIIRGLIFQLLQSQPNLFDFILPSFKIQKESLFTSSSFETLWRIFETMLRDPVLGTVYCVLDGLDECNEASLVVLLKKFRTLFSTESSVSSTCHLNLIIVSRDYPDFIPEILSGFPRIQLDSNADKEVNNDIHRFIEVKIDELSRSRQYPEQLCIHVKKVFYNRAKGTFLWVGIAAEALREYRNSEVAEALDKFPPGLDELYARILLQINVDRRETAAKILRWTVMAIRPLTLSELSIAVDVKPSVGFSRDEVMRDQVSYCGYFLTIKNDEVGLIHQSAKDYLLRKSRDPNPELEIFRVKEDTGNLEVAQKCLHYLQDGAFADGPVNLALDRDPKNISRLKDFPLLSYAAMHWPEHSRSLARSDVIFKLSLSFYAKKSPVRESWLQTYWTTKMHKIPPNSFTLLHIASFFDILPLAENLILKKGWINRVKRLFYINQKDSDGSTALLWAAIGGHEAIVQLLLEKGADINIKTSDGSTALLGAAERGHEAVVRLLLEKGADVNIKDSDGSTALLEAAGKGHEAIVRLLLEKGADVNIKISYGSTAFLEAAKEMHEAVVRLLLEKGADINIKDSDGSTALLWAAGEGHEAVVRLLLEKGADINIKDSYGSTALLWAAIGGHEAVVRLLLEKGANINIKDSYGSTALLGAAIGGHETIVRLLLEKGADINIKDSYGSTALLGAARRGHEAVVRLLLEKGADINIKASNGSTALLGAAMLGHEAVVRLLLEKGADINIKDSDRSTVFLGAARRGHEAVVRLLLEKGTDINIKASNGSTALLGAAMLGHEAVVRLLLEKGADINIKTSDGSTALLEAAGKGHEAIVRLLVEKEADINIKTSNK